MKKQWKLQVVKSEDYCVEKHGKDFTPTPLPSVQRSLALVEIPLEGFQPMRNNNASELWQPHHHDLCSLAPEHFHSEHLH